jgi:pSer/pThr/pTyr-binding forkhead associated (FHA) protein
MDDPRQPPALPRVCAPEETAPTSELPPDFVPLRLVLQPSGMAVELTRPSMVLGRHSEADVRLPLPDVSRRHCRFFFEGQWRVQDLNSLNGTFVNDEPIREVALQQGDEIRIGGFTFLVEIDSATAPAEAADDGAILRHLFRSVPRQQRRAS